jgi:hypothetical protein
MAASGYRRTRKMHDVIWPCRTHSNQGAKTRLAECRGSLVAEYEADHERRDGDLPVAQDPSVTVTGTYCFLGTNTVRTY